MMMYPKGQENTPLKSFIPRVPLDRPLKASTSYFNKAFYGFLYLRKWIGVFLGYCITFTKVKAKVQTSIFSPSKEQISMNSGVPIFMVEPLSKRAQLLSPSIQTQVMFSGLLHQLSGLGFKKGTF